MYAEAFSRGDGKNKASVAAIGAYFDDDHLYLDKYAVAKQPTKKQRKRLDEIKKKEAKDLTKSERKFLRSLEQLGVYDPTLTFRVYHDEATFTEITVEWAGKPNGGPYIEATYDRI